MRHGFIAALAAALSACVCAGADAQEGHYGVGHHKWHRDFYAGLTRNDGQSPCCSQTDCRPTQSRRVGDHYEVRVDGEWVPVPTDKITHVLAPDGGAHVCAPKQDDYTRGVLFCVILPPDS